MSESPLDDRVREHYLRQSLDESALARLRESARGDGPAREVPARRFLPFAAAAAAILLAIAIWGSSRSDGVAGTLTEEVRLASLEIAANHLADYDVEFHVDDYAELGGRMPRLAFAPRRPASDLARELVFDGGRYCSVRGEIAAQIRLRDGTERLTLYEFACTPVFEGLLEPVVQDVDGVEVTIWREDDMILGLARAGR